MYRRGGPSPCTCNRAGSCVASNAEGLIDDGACDEFDMAKMGPAGVGRCVSRDARNGVARGGPLAGRGVRALAGHLEAGTLGAPPVGVDCVRAAVSGVFDLVVVVL